MSTAREEMIDSIRRALRDREGPGRSLEDQADPLGFSVAEGGEVAGGGTPPDALDVLQSRIADYQATVLRCDTRALSGCLSERLRSRRVERLVVPSNLPGEWISGAGAVVVQLLKDGDPSFLSTAELGSVDAVVTGCALAIAETGTLVLDGGLGQGRRAISLLPDYHVCVVMKEQVVGTVDEGIARLQLSQGADPGPLTLISGPSATSDIELIRVEGVHGPRTLDVILVEDH